MEHIIYSTIIAVLVLIIVALTGLVFENSRRREDWKEAVDEMKEEMNKICNRRNK